MGSVDAEGKQDAVHEAAAPAKDRTKVGAEVEEIRRQHEDPDKQDPPRRGQGYASEVVHHGDQIHAPGGHCIYLQKDAPKISSETEAIMKSIMQKSRAVLQKRLLGVVKNDLKSEVAEAQRHV